MRNLKIVALSGILAVSLFGSETHSFLGIGAGSGKISMLGSDYDKRELMLKWGAYHITNKNILLGYSISGSYGKVKDLADSKTTELEVDLNLGYRVLSDYKLDVYLIGAGKYGAIENTGTAGYGYGVGVAKNLWDFGRIAVEAKKFNMSMESGGDYDETNIVANLVFFLK